MAFWHDIAARALRLGHRRAPAPGGSALTANTEAGPVPLWIYRGSGAGDDAPVYVHVADTGFLHPALAGDHALGAALADALGIVVLIVAPPGAPAHRFPVAPTQTQAVVWWAMLAGRKQGWNGKRLALGGRGTGAGLALGACLELPARMGVKPAGVVALAPVLDLTRATSWREAIALAAYLPDVPARSAPLASPLNAPPESLAGFAPTLVVVGESDPRRGEGEAFAAMLQAAGRDVHLALMPRAEAAQSEVAAFLARVLALKS